MILSDGDGDQARAILRELCTPGLSREVSLAMLRDQIARPIRSAAFRLELAKDRAQNTRASLLSP
jgi:hypothetical protein